MVSLGKTAVGVVSLAGAMTKYGHLEFALTLGAC